LSFELSTGILSW